MTCVLDSCNQGREPCADPAVCCGRSRRVSEADMLRQCARSGQVDSRQIAAHAAAGELDGLGVEAADAPRVTGLVPPIVTTELRPVRDRGTWPAFARWSAAVGLCVLWAALVIYAR